MNLIFKNILILSIFIFSLSSVYSIALLRDDIFNSEITQVKFDENYVFNLTINFENRIEDNLNFDVEIIYPQENIIVNSKSFYCSSHCKNNFILDKTFFGLYKIYITTIYKGKLYQQILKLNLGKNFNSDFKVNLEPNYYIDKNTNANIYGIIDIENPNDYNYFKFVFNPKSSPDLKTSFDFTCQTKKCNFDFKLKKNVFIEEYDLNVYSISGSTKNTFNILFDKNIISQEINEGNQQTKNQLTTNNNEINLLPKENFNSTTNETISQKDKLETMKKNFKSLKIKTLTENVNTSLSQISMDTRDDDDFSFIVLEQKLDGSEDMNFIIGSEAENYKPDSDVVSVTKLNDKNKRLDLNPQIDSLKKEEFEDKKESIKRISLNKNKKEILKQAEIRPGIYKEDNFFIGDNYYALGLLTINTKKPMYKPNDLVEFVFVVLDSSGFPYSKANLILNIEKPDKSIEVLSTKSRSILVSEKPGIYYGFFNATLTGKYKLVAQAQIDNFIVNQESYFNVKENFPFQIIRDVPATIDPWQGSFRNDFKITSNKNKNLGNYNLIEKIPYSFNLYENNADVLEEQEDYIILKWKNINDSFTPFYVANSPLISPYLYELGPAKIEYTNKIDNQRSDGSLTSDLYVSNSIFYENRSWMFAIDPLIFDTNSRTCSDTFGFQCSDWPSSSEGDNTFDTCPTSAGSDEHIIEATFNQTEALPNSQVQISCEFDPYSNGNEEYIYYYDGTTWTQIYSGNAPNGNIHTVSANFTLSSSTGVHWARCIIDWDGENDECANSGSYYDNDDVSIKVINPFLSLLSPENISYPNSAVETKISTTKNSNISYRIDSRTMTQVCSNCTSFNQMDYYTKGSHSIEVVATNLLTGEENIWTEIFNILSNDVNPLIDNSSKTCSDTFGFNCSDWPSSSEGDNTFDACPSSIGGSGDEHVVESILSQSTAYTNDTINVTCVFDPYSSGTEEYIYYFNTTGWTQLYSSNPVDGAVHNVSVAITLHNATGVHWFRCIADWDGENDECANSGSYYDNDDVDISVSRFIQNPPFVLALNKPENITYSDPNIPLDFASSLPATMQYSIDDSTYILACDNCTSYTNTRFLRDGSHNLKLKVTNPQDNSTIYNNVTFSLTSPTSPPLNATGRTCTDTFSSDCGLWPSSSENDNTFDLCPNSIGGSSDEHVVEAILSSTVANVGDIINVTCVFDPYSSGTEEYIYYFNTTGWTQLYSGNPVDGNIHNISITLALHNTSGTTTHWFRCIADWDGENDECANSGSYYDNDDVNITVIRPILIPFDLEILSPVSAIYTNASILLDLLTTKNASFEYKIDSGSYINVCTNCNSYKSLLTISAGVHTLTVLANETSSSQIIIKNVTFEYKLSANVLFSSFNGATTNFTNVTNISNVCSPILEKIGFGKIEYQTCIDANNADLDSFVTIATNNIGVNSQVLPNYNQSANLTFYNLNISNPRILNDNSFCDSCSLLSNNFKNITIFVPHFSNYKIVENRTLDIFDDTDSQTKRVDDQINFFANYYYNNNASSISDANCSIKFNTSSGWTTSFLMNYNSTSNYYEFNISFNESQNSIFNITCNHLSYPKLEVSDSFIVSPLVLGVDNLILYSSNFTNMTYENLTCDFDLVSAQSSVINWYKESNSLTLINTPFEGSNTTSLLDFSGNNLNIINSTASFNSTAGFNSNGAYYFDGNNDFLDFGDIDYMDQAQKFTIMMWFKREVDNSGTSLDTNHKINNVLLAQSSGSANDNLEIGTEGNNIEMYFDASANYNLVYNAAIVDNTWYHLAVSFNYLDTTGEVKLYLNGILVNTFTDTTTDLDNSATSPLSLGISRPYSKQWGDFNGYIDDFKIFYDELNPAQIYAIYNNDSKVIVSNQTSVYETWQCRVFAFDSLNVSNPFSSSNLLILDDSPLSVDSINLYSSNFTNTTNEDLICNYTLSATATNSVTSWFLNNNPLMIVNTPFEGSNITSLLDFSGNSNDLTLNNATYQSNSSFDGSGDYVFDGDNDYLNFGDIDEFDEASEFSVSLWFKRAVDNSGTALDTNHKVNNVLLAQSSGSSNDNLEIGTENGFIEVYLDTESGTSETHRFDAGIVNNKWYHLVIDFDSTRTNELMFYLNGTNVANFSNPAGIMRSSGTSPLSLGIARPNSDQWGDFNGSIDEVKIYSRSLSNLQILNIYNNSLDTISFEETKVDDLWQCRVAPFSNNDSGFLTPSNILQIVEIPEINLLFKKNITRLGSNIFKVNLGLYNKKYSTPKLRDLKIYFFIPDLFNISSFITTSSTWYSKVFSFEDIPSLNGTIYEYRLSETNSKDNTFARYINQYNSTNSFEIEFNLTGNSMYSLNDFLVGFDPVIKELYG